MKWISVKEQVPSHDEPIVYCMPQNRTPYIHGRWHVGIAYWTVSEKWNPNIYSEKYKEGFTHWMPLPDYPKEVS